MSTINVDQVARQIIDSGESMARNIWLAGLGIYSRSVEEAQQLNIKGNKMFDDLVERGKEVEVAAKDKVSLAKERTGDHLEDQFNDALYRVSGIDRARLDKLDDKLDRLTQVVEALVAAQQPQAAAKSPMEKESK